MGKYTEHLYQDDRKKKTGQASYQEQDLRGMTTFHLKEICRKERIVGGMTAGLDREAIIREILKFRGEKPCVTILAREDAQRSTLEDFFQKVRLREREEASIHFPSRITVYEDTAMDAFDQLYPDVEGIAGEGCLFLFSAEEKLCGIFQLEKDENGEFYVSRHKDAYLSGKGTMPYKMLFLEKREAALLRNLLDQEQKVLPGSIPAVTASIGEVEIKKLPSPGRPLVIDFGSSGTAAGICEESGQIRCIHSRDRRTKEVIPVIPSMAVLLPDEDGAVEMYFGTEAARLEEKNWEERNLPVFHDLKRWLTDLDRAEWITRVNGGKTAVPRREILSGFLQYIIEAAKQQLKQQFSNIYILTPLKRQSHYTSLFQELLPGYQVEASLDEGSAVVFQSIEEVIAQKKFHPGNWYRVLLLDCGGGSTDLSTAEFSIENEGYSFRIGIRSAYENGTADFGGSHMNYRIMELLKVKLAGALTGKSYSFPDDRLGSFFRQVDKEGTGGIYRELDAKYEEAEKWFPTRFASFAKWKPEDYCRVKNNFYYLFGLAEEIKKSFFQEKPLYHLSLKPDRFRLSLFQNGSFGSCPEGLMAEFSLHEVQAVLKPDIYRWVKRFLEGPYKKKQLHSYSIIRLAGQSCLSGLFLDAFKEFIPGRMIRSRERQESYGLKLCCLKGALSYYYGRKSGYYNVTQSLLEAGVPYTVSAMNHEREEIVLIRALDEKRRYGTVSRYMEGDTVTFFLKDQEGKLLKSVPLAFLESDAQAVTYEEIKEEYGSGIVQEETDTIRNGESKFFVSADRERWGFTVLPFMRREDQMYKGKPSFFPFEDGSWEADYFDGSW